MKRTESCQSFEAAPLMMWSVTHEVYPDTMDSSPSQKSTNTNKMGFSVSTQNSETKVPKVSIGLPVRNGERFLEEALQSLVDQDLLAFNAHAKRREQRQMDDLGVLQFNFQTR